MEHDELCERGKLYIPHLCYCVGRAKERALIPDELRVVYPWAEAPAGAVRAEDWEEL